MYWFHEREVLTFSSCLILEKCKESFSESKSTGWWHAVFEHLDEVPLRHHRFIITRSEEFLSCLEPGPLIEGSLSSENPFPTSLPAIIGWNLSTRPGFAVLRFARGEMISGWLMRNAGPVICFRTYFQRVSVRRSRFSHSYLTPSSWSFFLISSSVAVRRLIPVFHSTASR